MNEYIKREDAVNAIRDKFFTMSICASVDERKGMKYAQDLCAKAVEQCPSADVSPVVHGKWIEEPVAENISMVKCSACRKYPEKKGQCFTQYCCLCGAKMDL